MDELQQKIKIKWVGGDSAGQDVSIRLVTDEPERETVAVVKVHSQVLITYSKYFKACLSERWSPDGSTCDFVLDLHADVDCYIDCFGRMDSPLLRNFGIIRYSLELLKVASRIEFQELMDSISRYLSTVMWTPEDEMSIREYSASPGFSRSHAEDLVERLGLDESDEVRHKQLCGVMQQCARSALSLDTSSKCSRVLFTELLQGIESATPSNFVKTVVMLFNREAKNTFHEFEKECQRQLNWERVSQLSEMMHWVLNAILRTNVAEDLVQSFAHLSAVQQRITSLKNVMHYTEFNKLAKLVLCLYEGVVTGHLLLETPARVALLVNWRPLLVSTLSKTAYDEATKKLFLTLPLKNRMELIKLHQSNFDEYTSTSSLISTFSKSCNWQAMKLDLDTSHPEDS